MAEKHIHTLRQYKYKNGEVIFFCTGETCKFKKIAGLMMGKISLCNKCGKEFRMNEISIRRVKPCCMDCTGIKAKEEIKDELKGFTLPSELASVLDRALAKKIEIEDEQDTQDDDDSMLQTFICITSKW